MTAPSGLLVVDKPAGWTSHDVVGRVRRVAGTRRIGHAGTLDPMATGVLVLGVERATRLLTFLVGAEKEYAATIRLGASTVTDDAEGEITSTSGAEHVTSDRLAVAVARLTGEIDQVPSSVSAVKVGGRRSYARVRSGQEVELAARRVMVSRFDVLRTRAVTVAGVPMVDVDAAVTCSSGTYVRALARDVGTDLGVGGHLTALRRTRVGLYGLETASTLEELADDLRLLPLADAARAALPARELTGAEAARLAHGQRLHASGAGEGPFAAFAPDGHLVAVLTESDGTARPLVVLAPA